MIPYARNLQIKVEYIESDVNYNLNTFKKHFNKIACHEMFYLYVLTSTYKLLNKFVCAFIHCYDG